MAQKRGHIIFTGTIGGLCFYKSGGRCYVRMASSLTGKRVKKDKAFRRTMENAAVLGRASRIGSSVYQALPKTFRQFWMYKSFTGEAIQWLRQGKTDEEARMILWKTYAEIWVNKESTSLLSATGNDTPGITPDKKKKDILVLKTSGELSKEIKQYPGKNGKENTNSPVISLLFSQRMVRRRRIRRA